jgi:photoactive yellow protein
MTINFDQPELISALHNSDESVFNAIHFGVIAFDAQGIVRRYNMAESQGSGLNLDQVMGLHLFSVVAQCMNNFLVAQRFEDAWTNVFILDDTIDYVLSLRMKPIAVKMRLLSSPEIPMQYICIQR